MYFMLHFKQLGHFTTADCLHNQETFGRDLVRGYLSWAFLADGQPSSGFNPPPLLCTQY